MATCSLGCCCLTSIRSWRCCSSSTKLLHFSSSSHLPAVETDDEQSTCSAAKLASVPQALKEAEQFHNQMNDPALKGDGVAKARGLLEQKQTALENAERYCPSQALVHTHEL